MKTCVNFPLPVYAANSSTLIAANDVLTLIVKDDDGTYNDEDVAVTSVSNNGHTVCFDRNLASNVADYRKCDIVRTHEKHQYTCPVALNYRALNVLVTGGGITGFTINGVATVLDTALTAAANDTDRETLENAINVVLNGNGYCTVVLDGASYDVYVMNSTKIAVATDEVGADADIAFVAF